MRLVMYFCAIALVFASCRTTRNAVLPANTNQPVLAYAATKPAQPSTSESSIIEKEIVEETPQSSIAVQESVSVPTEKITTRKKVTSFAQFKEMARSGEIVLSKKDAKTLNKLEKHFKGDYQKFRSETFEFSIKAKIIAGIGLLGLLLAIFAGSGFGLFLFILAALAFILRYFDVIAF